LSLTGHAPIDPSRGLKPLRFFADFDQVPFGVADFKKVRVAAILDWPNQNAVTRKKFTSFL
jgi:hypothetical protein